MAASSILPPPAGLNLAEGQATSMTQTPSSSHHHSHQKEQQQQHLSLLSQQRQHHFQVQQNQQILSSSRRNSSAACGGVASGTASTQQQLHLDPLNAVALPGSGIITDSQQMLQLALPQQQQNFTSSSMIGSNNYQQSSMLQRNVMPNGSNSRLSTVSKHSISHNMASNLQYVPGGELFL